MDRIEFLCGLTGAMSFTFLPSPSPTSHIKPSGLDECTANPTLPYDRPIDISMRVLDGPDFRLMNYRKTAVWMNIFATWCEPCNQEQPFVQATAQAYHDSGLRVIGVNFRETDDTVRAYRKKYGLTYPLAMDANGGFTRGLENNLPGGSLLFPASLFFTADGYLDCYFAGSMQEAEMRYKVARILKTVPKSQS